MNRKKIVALIMVVALALTTLVGGTMAYFTDDDDATNTFTVGNVAIEIEELMKDEEGTWVDYTDEQHLSPIAQKKAPFNKLVLTENTGTEPAYIRTFITCPKDMYDILGLGFHSGSAAKDPIEVDGKTARACTWKDVGTFTINGEETSVFLCEVVGTTDEEKVVEAGEYFASLTKVWLYHTLTNEQVTSFGLDKIDNLGSFKVEVASQAIQSANLTYEEAMAELGEIDQALMDELFNS